jgi:fructose 1,6-bisphosphate aldolase/phosphatase
VAAVKTTISLIKADIGSIGGHVRTCDITTDVVCQTIDKAHQSGLIIDYKIWNAGDDTEILMTHTRGVDDEEIHKVAFDALMEGAKNAKERGLYGAGQDILKEAFSGNVRGMGPGVAEMEFEERPADPFVVFTADKTAPGAFNYPIFRVFADPFNTAGLIIDPKLHDGFVFEVYDIKNDKMVKMDTPSELYDLLALIGATEDYVIKRVHSKDKSRGVAAVISTEKLYAVAGKYIGKDDPGAIVRAQSGFPATGEILEGFALGHLVTNHLMSSMIQPGT